MAVWVAHSDAAACSAYILFRKVDNSLNTNADMLSILFECGLK